MDNHRRARTLYGIGVSFVGLAMLFWLPGPMWLRHITGWGVMLYGGMFVDPDAVKEWDKLFGEMLPTKGDDDGNPGPDGR